MPAQQNYVTLIWRLWRIVIEHTSFWVVYSSVFWLISLLTLKFSATLDSKFSGLPPHWMPGSDNHGRRVVSRWFCSDTNQTGTSAWFVVLDPTLEASCGSSSDQSNLSVTFSDLSPYASFKHRDESCTIRKCLALSIYSYCTGLLQIIRILRKPTPSPKSLEF